MTIGLIAPPYSARPSFSALPINAFDFGSGTLPRNLDHMLEAMREAFERQPAQRRAQDDVDLWAFITAAAADYIKVFRCGPRSDAELVITTLFATALTHGFQQGHHCAAALRNDGDARIRYAAIILDRLVRLAEALGARDCVSAEHLQTTIAIDDLEGLISAVEKRVGFDLTPPSLDGCLFGIRTQRGIFTDRHFDGIYAAWRLQRLAEQMQIGAPTVVEIGGGAGYAAYYGVRAGFARYTVIDLMPANIVQYLMLGSAFGCEVVGLGKTDKAITLLSNETFPEIKLSSSDLLFNADSLPEMPISVATEYLARATGAGAFLSINQESRMANGSGRQGVVRELGSAVGLKSLYRVPAWMRTGYVEEMFVSETSTKL